MINILQELRAAPGVERGGAGAALSEAWSHGERGGCLMETQKRQDGGSWAAGQGPGPLLVHLPAAGLSLVPMELSTL